VDWGKAVTMFMRIIEADPAYRDVGQRLDNTRRSGETSRAVRGAKGSEERGWSLAAMRRPRGSWVLSGDE
jgi:hypothetical protein